MCVDQLDELKMKDHQLALLDRNQYPDRGIGLPVKLMQGDCSTTNDQDAATAAGSALSDKTLKHADVLQVNKLPTDIVSPSQFTFATELYSTCRSRPYRYLRRIFSSVKTSPLNAILLFRTDGHASVSCLYLLSLFLFCLTAYYYFIYFFN